MMGCCHRLQVLLPAAGLLQLQEVKRACCEFLSTQLHPTNCLGIQAFADLHACTELLSLANAYAGESGETCPDWGRRYLSLSLSRFTARLFCPPCIINPPDNNRHKAFMLFWYFGPNSKHPKSFPEMSVIHPHPFASNPQSSISRRWCSAKSS